MGGPHFIVRWKMDMSDLYRSLLNGTDPTTQVKGGRTHPHLVSQKGHMDVAQFLVGHGADVTAQDMSSMARFHPVLVNEYLQVVQSNLWHSAAQTMIGGIS